MTLERDPCSIEDTLRLVTAELSIGRAAEVTGHSTGYLYALTHPQSRERLCVQDLELLDLAHQEKFGNGFPLFETLGRRLATARSERFADCATIGRHGVRLARENGEAVAALLEASLVAGDRKLVVEALRQTEDVHRETTAIIASLRAVLERAGAAPPDTS